MRSLIYHLGMLLIVAACINKNPQINKAWNVRYPEYSRKDVSYKIKLRKSNPLRKLETASEYFTLNSHDTVFTGEKGTIIYINRSCLNFEDRSSVTGPVKIELREVFSKSDLILNNKPTVSDKKMLVSAGALYLNATSEGKNLIISCPEGLSISVPRQSWYPGMQVFNGVLNENGDINWVAEEKKEIDQEESVEYYEGDIVEAESFNPEMLQILRDDSWEEDTYFNFSAGKFGWINCDAFYEDTRPKSNLVVKISNPLPEDFQTRAFIVFKNMNSVLQVYSTGPDLFESPAIPEGEEVYLVCISGNEKALFSDIRKLTLQSHQMETVVLKETDERLLKEQISKLN